MKKMTTNLKDELKQFIGTIHLYKIPPSKVMITDGVLYFADKAKAFWLLSDIAAVKYKNKKVCEEDFIVIKTEPEGDNGLSVTYEDGDCNILYKQHYDYTDLPDDKRFELWMEGTVILLPSEH